MLINEGTYWRLSDPFTDEIAAWMSVSKEQDHALVSVVRLMARANQATVYVRLRGLKPYAVYLEEQSGRQYFGAALCMREFRFRRLPRNMRRISLPLPN